MSVGTFPMIGRSFLKYAFPTREFAFFLCRFVGQAPGWIQQIVLGVSPEYPVRID